MATGCGHNMWNCFICSNDFSAVWNKCISTRRCGIRKVWLYNSTVKGMGKINISMVSSVVELCSKIGLSLLLPIWIGTTGIWFAAPIGYILGIIPLLIYYYSGRWKKLLTVPAAEPAKA